MALKETSTGGKQSVARLRALVLFITFVIVLSRRRAYRVERLFALFVANTRAQHMHVYARTVYCTRLRDKTKRTGMRMNIPAPRRGDLVSSFAYANRGIRAGHVALHARSGVLCPRERVIVVSSRLLSSKHVRTIDNIVRNSTSPPGPARERRTVAARSFAVDSFRLRGISNLITRRVSRSSGRALSMIYLPSLVCSVWINNLQ